jgi:hypothetical protein
LADKGLLEAGEVISSSQAQRRIAHLGCHLLARLIPLAALRTISPRLPRYAPLPLLRVLVSFSLRCL